MDLKKFLADQNMQNIPAGLSGCRAYGNQFDSCDYDVVIFDGKQGEQAVEYDGQLVKLHHYQLDEARTSSLVHLVGMQIIQDDSWDLRILKSKLEEKRPALFQNHAKNCLIDSLFCCEKSRVGLDSDVFSPCWQRCASYYLADAILTLNQNPPSPSHALELARKFEKNNANEKMSIVTRTLGIERATPSLLGRMLKSTIGFSDIVKGGTHSKTIQDKHDYFVKNAMLSDCYFYLAYVNYANFIEIKDSVLQNPDLIHILKVAFDLEFDSVVTLQNTQLVQDACHEILSILHS